MSGSSSAVTFSDPCPICGKPDWCNRVVFENGNRLAYCKRKSGNKGDVIAASGDMWVYRKVTKEKFHVWEPKAQYEANLEKYLSEKSLSKGKAVNYNFTASKGTDNSDYIDWNGIPLEGVTECTDPKRLDTVYRVFLELLELEDKHRERLLLEWNGDFFNSVMKHYIIRSIPPEDRIRFSSKEKLKNFSRKKIMEKLIEKVGEPMGIPGFYQRPDGTWTFYYLCGIAYPVYDCDGNIIRLRIGTDYPIVKGEFMGKECEFVYGLIDDKVGWFARFSRDEEPILVWEYGSTNNRIELDKKGYPKGKINGKYKSFTSLMEKRIKDENGNPKRVNRYWNGSKATNYCSLYSKPGDDFTIVYVTEGEKKSIVGNMMMNVPLIAVPGVSSLGIMFEKELGKEKSLVEQLIERGTKAFVVVFDADKKVNEAVLNSEQNLLEEFKKRGIAVATGEWNANWGKGLDDILLTGVVPDIRFIR